MLTLDSISVASTTQYSHNICIVVSREFKKRNGACTAFVFCLVPTLGSRRLLDAGRSYIRSPPPKLNVNLLKVKNMSTELLLTHIFYTVGEFILLRND